MSDTMNNKWVINGLLAVILVLLAGIYFRTDGNRAHAAGEGWGTDGVVVMNTNNNMTDALILVDTRPDKQQIMVYRARSGDFKLIGTRSYKYDVEMEDSAELKPPMSAQGWTYIQAKKAYEDAQSKK